MIKKWILKTLLKRLTINISSIHGNLVYTTIKQIQALNSLEYSTHSDIIAVVSLERDRRLILFFDIK